MISNDLQLRATVWLNLTNTVLNQIQKSEDYVIPLIIKNRNRSQDNGQPQALVTEATQRGFWGAGFALLFFDLVTDYIGVCRVCKKVLMPRWQAASPVQREWGSRSMFYFHIDVCLFLSPSLSLTLLKSLSKNIFKVLSCSVITWPFQ